jgi:hypothetical protein
MITKEQREAAVREFNEALPGRKRRRPRRRRQGSLRGPRPRWSNSRSKNN